MNEYRWDDIKNLVEKKWKFHIEWKDFHIVLFGLGMNGSFAYERLKKYHKIYAFTDNNALLGGVIIMGCQ